MLMVPSLCCRKCQCLSNAPFYSIIISFNDTNKISKTYYDVYTGSAITISSINNKTKLKQKKKNIYLILYDNITKEIKF